MEQFTVDPDWLAVDSVMRAFERTRVLQVGMHHGIFDRLTDGATAAEVSASQNLDPRAAVVLLDALVAMEFLGKSGQTYYNLSVAQKYLVSESEAFVGAFIKYTRANLDLWLHMEDMVSTGRPPSTYLPFDSGLASTRLFFEALGATIRARNDESSIRSLVDFDRVRSILDLGAGPGTLSIALCRQYPKLSAVLVDSYSLPGSVELVREYSARNGVSHQIEIVISDFSDNRPFPVTDVVLCSQVCHLLDIETNRNVIRKAFSSLPPGGYLILRDEFLNEDRTAPVPAAMFGLTMLLTGASGRCFTFGEVTNWLDEAGFVEVITHELPPPQVASFVVGRKPNMAPSFLEGGL